MSAAERQSREKSDSATAGKRQVCQEEENHGVFFPLQWAVLALVIMKAVQQSMMVFMCLKHESGAYAVQKKH